MLYRGGGGGGGGEPYLRGAAPWDALLGIVRLQTDLESHSKALVLLL